MLAAGASHRFGSDKLLHPVTLHEVTLPLAAHSLLPWLETFGIISVIVRPEADAFCSAIETALGTGSASKIHWVVCENAAQGMSASLACGVRANREVNGWLIGLADMPAVPTEVIVGVRNALLNGAKLSAPYCNGKRGHPVGFASCYREELLAFQGDVGARGLIERDKSFVVPINIGGKGILTDVDIPDDLRSL